MKQPTILKRFNQTLNHFNAYVQYKKRERSQSSQWLGVLSILLLLSLLGTACVPLSPDLLTSTPDSSSSATGEPIAMIISTKGAVFIEEPLSIHRTPGLMSIVAQSGSQPSAFQVIRNGRVIRVEEGGEVTILCYNNKVYRVTERSVTPITPGYCGNGLPAPNRRRGASVAPGDGGSREIEEPELEDENDYGRIPIILTPRDTQIQIDGAEFRWVAVEEVAEYQFNLNGPDGEYPPITVEAESLTCVENAITDPHLICTYPWPETWTLVSDEVYFLTIGARQNLAAAQQKSDASRLQTLSSDMAAQLQADIEQVEEMALDELTHDLLVAGLYIEQELYTEAIDIYATIANTQAAPLPYIRLGDLYRAVDLQRFALDAYQKAFGLMESISVDPSVDAAAAFGIGATYFNQGEYALAEPYFVEAVDLYQAIGDEEALVDSEKALQETQEEMN